MLFPSKVSRDLLCDSWRSTPPSRVIDAGGEAEAGGVDDQVLLRSDLEVVSGLSAVCVLVSAIRCPPSRKLGSLQLGLQLGLGLELKPDSLVWLVLSLISRVELGLVLEVELVKYVK